MENEESSNFEEIVAEISEILEKIETKDTDLATSLAAYEQGVLLIRRAHALLSAAEQRIVTLQDDAQADTAESSRQEETP